MPQEFVKALHLIGHFLVASGPVTSLGRVHIRNVKINHRYVREYLYVLLKNKRKGEAIIPVSILRFGGYGGEGTVEEG